MNLDDEMELEKGKTKFKIWMCLVVILVFVVGSIWFIYSIYSSFKALLDDLSTSTFYVLEIDNENEMDVISILSSENRNYCESIYKIEYKNNFPNDYSARIYCNNEDDIEFVISDNENSKLIKYIYDFGIMEKRKN